MILSKESYSQFSLPSYVLFWLSLIAIGLFLFTTTQFLKNTQHDQIGHRVIPMSFTPPTNADAMSDFAPPRVKLSEWDTAVSSGNVITANILNNRNNMMTINDGRFGVVIEKGTFDQNHQLVFKERQVDLTGLNSTRTTEATLPSITLAHFDIEVIDQEGIYVDQFDKYVRLVIDVRELVQDANPIYRDFYLSYWDEVRDVWVKVPTTLHQADGLISAELSHFSEWQLGVNPQQWTPTWTPPTVSEFSGAATYSYPIEVPEGRGGLQPSIALSYSSRAIDGRIHDIQGETIADGWSIADISIVRVGVELQQYEQSGGTNQTELLFPDKFRLSLNGSGHELIKDGDTLSNELRFYVKDRPDIRVTRIFDPTIGNYDGIYWLVDTPNGTRYRLGFTPGSERWQEVPNYWNYNIDNGHNGRDNKGANTAWYVDTITDIDGNQIEYQYHTAEADEFVNTNLTIDAQTNRIANIYYNYKNQYSGTFPVSGTTPIPSSDANNIAASRIRFLPADTSVIGEIQVFHHGSDPNVQLHQYEIVTGKISEPSNGCRNPAGNSLVTNTDVVLSITQKLGIDAHVLPSTEFSYTSFPHYVQPEGTYAGQSCFSFAYLTQVENGYGASTSFEYAFDNRFIGSFSSHTTGVGPVIIYPKIGYNGFVKTAISNDGFGNASSTSYVYETPCYGQTKGEAHHLGSLPNAAVCANQDSPELGNIVGFARTYTTQNDFDGTPLTRNISTFYLQDPYQGQAFEQEFGYPDDSVIAGKGIIHLARTENLFYGEKIPGTSTPKKDSTGIDIPDLTYGPGLSFTPLRETTQIQYSSGENSPQLKTMTLNFYQTQFQGDAQYGQLTKQNVFYFDKNDNHIIHQRHLTRYVTATGNNDSWVIVPWMQGVYNGDWEAQRLSLMYYDENINNPDTQSLTQGKLTLNRTVLIDDPDASTFDTIDIFTEYDDNFGNVERVTTYSEYGEVGRTGAIYNHSTLPPVSSAIPTEIHYDNIYNLYPTHSIDVLGYQTDYEFYGFTDSIPSGSGTLQPSGSLRSIEDPNGIITAYKYDPFGRLLAIYDDLSDPGLSTLQSFVGDPVTEYKYWDYGFNHTWESFDVDNGKPMAITTIQRPESFKIPEFYTNSPYAFQAQTFFDGYGRPVQDHVLWADIDGQSGHASIISLTEYDALGRTICQSTPYSIAGSSYYSPVRNESCAGQEHTATEFDILGRPQLVTTPSGDVTDYNYGIHESLVIGNYDVYWLNQVYDANGHVVNQFTNVLGELIRVREFNGNGAITTDYTYDNLGNLTHVTDDEGNTTHLIYDNLGRKTRMTDPDMGTWNYEYDPRGNLSKQTDAEGQSLCFTYDLANRLEQKRVCNNTVLATYTYDSAPMDGAGTGRGLLHTINWFDGTNNNLDSFVYDELGRVKQQTRQLAERSFSLSTTYDVLNRPVNVTYPNEETLTYTYDHEGEEQLETSFGNQVIAQNFTFNDRGQLTSFSRGNGINTTYDYFGANGANGNNNYRLESIAHGNNGDAFPSFFYAYDPVGNITQISERFTQGAAGDVTVQTFTYDQLNRLETAVGTAINGEADTDYSYEYFYDDIGNITSIVRDGLATNYLYTPAQNPTAQPHAVKSTTGDRTGTYSYDDNGNMRIRIEDGVTYIQDFDIENRMTSVTVGDEVTSFWYDPTGQRTMTLEPDGTMIYYPFPNYEEEVQPNSGPPIDPTPTITPSPTPTETPAGCVFSENNEISNPSFENGTSGWSLKPTNGSGGSIQSTSEDKIHCDNSAKISILNAAINNRLDQSGITLEANTQYRLTFAGKSSSGNDLSLFLNKQGGNFENYGLGNVFVELTTQWQYHTVEFTTTNITGTVNDGRLRFSFNDYDINGGIYWIDNVVLEKVDGNTAQQDSSSSVSITALQQPLVEASSDTILNGKPAQIVKPSFNSTLKLASNILPPIIIADFENGIDSNGSLAVYGNITHTNIAYAWNIPHDSQAANDDINYWDVISDNDGDTTEYVDYRYTLPTPQDWTNYDILRIKVIADCVPGCNAQQEIRVIIHDADGTGNNTNTGYHWVAANVLANDVLDLDISTVPNKDEIDHILIRIEESFINPSTDTVRVHLYYMEVHDVPDPTPIPPTPTNTFTPTPTNTPSPTPTHTPTSTPTNTPTNTPTTQPTQEPTAEPTQEPTAEPTQEPTAEPTVEPTIEPTVEPTEEPTDIPTATSTPTLGPTTPPSGCTYNENNKVSNPSFEDGTTDWLLKPTNGNGGSIQSTSEDKIHCDYGAKITISNAAINNRLDQSDITLEEDTEYRLTFAAKSSSGNDLSLYLNENGGDFVNYGLGNVFVALTTEWQYHTVEFTTKNFSGTVNNGRLRFSFKDYDVNGDIYWLDHIVLEKVDDIVEPSPTVTATPTSPPTITPSLTPTSTPTEVPTELVIQRLTYVIGGKAVGIHVEGNIETDENGVFYFFDDHLGSTSLTADSSGNLVGDITRFMPFGEYRTAPQYPIDNITDMGFTGHKHNDDIGLIYMNARYYLPGVGKFASADTIVPRHHNPQSFNRYSYVLNNPIKFIDPSGHCVEGQCEAWLNNWQNENEKTERTPIAPLPDSVVQIKVYFSDGTSRTSGLGSAIDTNAVLTHNHLNPTSLSLADIEIIELVDIDGNQIMVPTSEFYIINTKSELGDMHGALMIIVFKEDFIVASKTASIGTGNNLQEQIVAQAVKVGASPGLYETKVIEEDLSMSSLDRAFDDIQALRVAPDLTKGNDSGAPLYVNGTIRGVNLAGDGFYGRISDVSLIRSQINYVTKAMRN